MRFEILLAIFGLLIAGVWSLPVEDAEPEVDPAAAADALLAVDAGSESYDESERQARGGIGIGFGVGFNGGYRQYGGYGGYGLGGYGGYGHGGYGGYGHHHHHHHHDHHGHYGFGY